MCNWRIGTGWLLVLLTSSGLAWAQHGAIRGVHDPVMIRENDTYYVFSSGAGVPVRVSKDMLEWKQIGRVFDEDVPAWAQKEIPQAQHVWAPDISYYNNRFHLYYSVSTLGSQRSCIGLATNKTLDPSSGEYKWVDHGKVIESFPGKVDHNAIDPNLVLDEHGNPWLVWGSFWDGIKLMRLNSDTGMPLADDDRISSLAARPRRHAIEAPFLVRKNAYYYLFVSFDHCCRGVASNYKIMVGRSRGIAGPYVDFDGQPLRDGGGTIVLAGYGEWRGPGHNGILLDANGDWLVHHMYDARANGAPTMQIRPLIWGQDGWPVVGEPVAAAARTAGAVQVSDLLGTWKHSVNFGAEDYLEFRPEGRMNAAVDRATWSLDGFLLELRWPDADAPGGAWIDTCHLARDGRSYVGRNQKGFVIRGTRSPEGPAAPR